MIQKRILLTGFSLIISLTVFGQDSLHIPLKVAQMIVRDLTKMDNLDTLARIQESHIQNLTKEVNLMDSTIATHKKKEGLQDSVIREKDGIIENQNLIIKKKSRGRVAWYFVPLAGLIAWALHP